MVFPLKCTQGFPDAEHLNQEILEDGSEREDQVGFFLTIELLVSATNGKQSRMQFGIGAPQEIQTRPVGAFQSFGTVKVFET